MKDVKLVISGQEIPVSYTLLKEISRNLGDEKHYAPIVKGIVSLGVPSLVKNLLGNENLAMEDLDKIWAGANNELKADLLETPNFIKNLSDEQAEEIIRLNDTHMLANLANYAEYLYPDRDSDYAKRLSGKMADELMNLMATHPDEKVKVELATNYQAPKKFKPPFSEIKNSLQRINGGICETITLNDVEFLRSCLH